eukprot:6179999-Pleurochrysis_carterae.AAC.1
MRRGRCDTTRAVLWPRLFATPLEACTFACAGGDAAAAAAAFPPVARAALRRALPLLRGGGHGAGRAPGARDRAGSGAPREPGIGRQLRAQGHGRDACAFTHTGREGRAEPVSINLAAVPRVLPSCGADQEYVVIRRLPSTIYCRKRATRLHALACV